MGTKRRPRTGVYWKSLSISPAMEYFILTAARRTRCPWPTLFDQIREFMYACNRNLHFIHSFLTISLPGFFPQDSRVFNGPDGLQYRWRPSTSSADVVVGVSHGIRPRRHPKCSSPSLSSKIPVVLSSPSSAQHGKRGTR